MNIQKIMNSMFYMKDVTNEFTKYGKLLDDYFSDENNITKHEELFLYYLDLKDNLKELAKKHKVVK